MLDYAVELTRAPHAITRRHVEALRAVGFEDAAILDICQVVAYYNYVNRLADGLGVDLEPSWEGKRLTMSRAEFERRLAERHGPGGAHAASGSP